MSWGTRIKGEFYLPQIRKGEIPERLEEKRSYLNQLKIRVLIIMTMYPMTVEEDGDKYSWPFYVEREWETLIDDIEQTIRDIQLLEYAELKPETLKEY